MKQNVLSLLTFLLLLVSVQPAAAVLRPIEKANTTEAVSAAEVEKAKADWNEMSRKEKRAAKKEMRKELKQAVKAQQQVDASTNTLLLVIVAILLPPLAMAIYDGLSNRFLISLLLTLLFYLPGLIYTLVVILGGK